MSTRLNIEEREPAEVEIYGCRYERLVLCKARNCRSLGTMIARYLDSSGIFVRQHELCAAQSNRHTRPARLFTPASTDQVNTATGRNLVSVRGR